MTEQINLLFFSLFLLLAVFRPLPLAKRRAAVGLGVLGIAITSVMHSLNDPSLNDWLPAALMPLAYWQTGRFFEQPNKTLQAFLERLDQKVLRDRRRSDGLEACLELAYFFCYPLVPLGVCVLYLSGLRSQTESYWTAVLPPTYFCYAMVPFAQTLPPWKSKEGQEKQNPQGSIRMVNMWVVRHLSTQANTFPSAHVAASFAVSLFLLQLVPLAGWIFLMIALSIAVGAVTGRYHYLADVLSATAVALASFFLTQLV